MTGSCTTGGGGGAAAALPPPALAPALSTSPGQLPRTNSRKQQSSIADVATGDFNREAIMARRRSWSLRRRVCACVALCGVIDRGVWRGRRSVSVRVCARVPGLSGCLDWSALVKVPLVTDDALRYVQTQPCYELMASRCVARRFGRSRGVFSETGKWSLRRHMIVFQVKSRSIAWAFVL